MDEINGGDERRSRKVLIGRWFIPAARERGIGDGGNPADPMVAVEKGRYWVWRFRKALRELGYTSVEPLREGYTWWELGPRKFGVSDDGSGATVQFLAEARKHDLEYCIADVSVRED